MFEDNRGTVPVFDLLKPITIIGALIILITRHSFFVCYFFCFLPSNSHALNKAYYHCFLCVITNLTIQNKSILVVMGDVFVPPRLFTNTPYLFACSISFQYEIPAPIRSVVETPPQRALKHAPAMPLWRVVVINSNLSNPICKVAKNKNAIVQRLLDVLHKPFQAAVNRSSIWLAKCDNDNPCVDRVQ